MRDPTLACELTTRVLAPVRIGLATRPWHRSAGLELAWIGVMRNPALGYRLTGIIWLPLESDSPLGLGLAQLELS
jgi:hypothetical protein